MVAISERKPLHAVLLWGSRSGGHPRVAEGGWVLGAEVRPTTRSPGLIQRLWCLESGGSSPATSGKLTCAPLPAPLPPPLYLPFPRRSWRPPAPPQSPVVAPRSPAKCPLPLHMCRSRPLSPVPWPASHVPRSTFPPPPPPTSLLLAQLHCALPPLCLPPHRAASPFRVRSPPSTGQPRDGPRSGGGCGRGRRGIDTRRRWLGLGVGRRSWAASMWAG